MTIVEAIRQLVDTLGGSYSAEDDTVSELLEQLNAAFENGGTTFVINADATMDGSTLTLTNIDKTPDELASVVAAKKPACLCMQLAYDEDATIPVYIPLTQVAGTDYDFCGVVHIDDSDGVSLTLVSFDGSGETFTSAGKIYVLPLTT